MEQQFQTIVNAVKPAVVEVIATREVSEVKLDPFFKDAFSGKSVPVRHHQNIGSGILIDSDGHIVTTGAVVANADKIEVKFACGQRQFATLLGLDGYSDIAVLRAEDGYPTKTVLGDSDQLRAGSWVVTVGCSIGACPTLSFGIVNGLEVLSDNPFYEAIQINAPVKPGNSGGAVANTSGQIVGVITATLAHVPLPHKSRSSEEHFPSNRILSGQDISFAIPIKTVQTIANHIIEHGEMPRGWLGVSVGHLDARGVQVKSVVEKSPAEDAGILRQDIILDFNGTPVNTYTDLFRLVTSLTPKTPVKVKVLRGSEHLALDVVLGRRD
jgi:S1-C subfamily serine protease